MSGRAYRDAGRGVISGGKGLYQMTKYFHSAALGGIAAVLMLAVPATQAQTPPAAPKAAAMTAMPNGFADLAAQLLPSVVNISTTQVVKSKPGAKGGPNPDVPQAPPGSPF